MVESVCSLLEQYGATATFFIISNFMEGYETKVDQLLKKGHELGNHCPSEARHDHLPEEEFELALLRTEEACDKLRPCKPALRWFRAPSAAFSTAMETVVAKHGFIHVLSD